ncbi:hypothetical protein PM082_006275 [Marasmius tenuissimus]|nr:hypothetical protein PM082_006275 [Marasmius tenuissimus]
MEDSQLQICGRESKPTIKSDHAANKHQRGDVSFGDIERNHPDQDFPHKNDTTSDTWATEEQNPRLVRPLPIRFSPFTAPVNLHSRNPHPQQGHQSQVTPPACYHSDQLPYSYLSRPTRHPSGTLSFAENNTNISKAVPYDSPSHPLKGPGTLHYTTLQLSVHSLDAATLFDPYSTVERTFPNNDYTDSAMNSAYTNPGIYSVDTAVSTAFGHGDDTGKSAGPSGSSQVAPSSANNATLATNLAHESNSQRTLAVPYPHSSALLPHLPDSPHGVAPMPHAHIDEPA